MTDQRPITPHRELIEQWASEKVYDERDWLYELHIAHQAARWGADQQLIACGNYLERCAAWEPEDVAELLNHFRPRPPSLKEQALQAWTAVETGTDDQMAMAVIRQALEQLDD